MIKFDPEKNMVVVESLDISNEQLMDEIRGYLDNEMQVQLLSLGKSNPSYKSTHTFTGKWNKQIGEGIVLSAYKAKSPNCLLELE